MAEDPSQSSEDQSTGMSGRPSVIFLPGIVMPAAQRYAPLLDVLAGSVRAVTRDLEVYATPQPPADYSIEHEVEGVSRTADAAGWDRFHLYGHSGGGAIAIAYAATYPERLLSLALDEPASDFSLETKTRLQKDFARRDQLPAPERMRAFIQMQLAPGVAPSPPPPGPPPAWMETRPAGIEAFVTALQRYRLSPERLRAFDRPVYYSYGSLSAPHWEVMRDSLADSFPDFTSERYEGLHHFNTSHFAEPGRVAAVLQRLWTQAEAKV